MTGQRTSQLTELIKLSDQKGSMFRLDRQNGWTPPTGSAYAPVLVARRCARVRIAGTTAVSFRLEVTFISKKAGPDQDAHHGEVGRDYSRNGMQPVCSRMNAADATVLSPPEAGPGKRMQMRVEWTRKFATSTPQALLRKLKLVKGGRGRQELRKAKTYQVP
jgi:hypothetical protein